MIATPIDAGVPSAAETQTPDSIEALARASAGHLLSVATGILGNPGEAEDAVQDALLLARKSWNQVREPERRSAWLTQICQAVPPHAFGGNAPPCRRVRPAR